MSKGRKNTAKKADPNSKRSKRKQTVHSMPPNKGGRNK